MAKPKNARVYYDKPLKKVFSWFNVNPEMGLSSEQAITSFHEHGPNEIKKVKRSFFKVIIAPIINLLIIIYLLSAVAMAALGEVERTTPTFIIVGFNIVVAVIQQYRAERKLEALHKLSQSTSKVLRHGEVIQIPSDKVVVGDIVILNRGDKVPADARIIESSNFLVDESSLTGESDPVDKQSNGALIKKHPLPIHKQKNMVFMGTFVSRGNAKAIVVKIGNQTEIGKISTMLEESNTGDIPLRKKMNSFAKYLGYGVLTLLTLSIIYKSYLLNQANNLTWNNFRLALIDSIDLGMKVMPINLPLLTTIILLTGILAMARKGVIVRELSRTESLGRVSVVCTDKTGTLTKNEMTVVEIWTPHEEYAVSGRGFSPEGNIRALNNYDKPLNDNGLESLVVSGYLNNNSTIVREEYDTLKKDTPKVKWSIIGHPTEGALRVLGKKYKSDIDSIEKHYSFVHEFHFDSSLKRMSKLFKNQKGMYLFSKGATEWLLPLCNRYSNSGEEYPLDSQMESRILDKMEFYAKEGYRILGIAYRKLNEDQVPQDLENNGARKELENDMIFLGFVVIYDPPREDVQEAIQECQKAQIKVSMITGDNLATGRAIARELGIYKEGENLAVEGKDIQDLTSEDFEEVSCFARVSPEHKQIIVKRYQDDGKVVSMSGDGVNDALALSLADCGLAMGIQGTEVAKEAADMVITDDSFATIVTGIRQGRGLFKKIRTIIYFFICISVMEAIILFSSTLGSDPYFAMFDYWQLNLLYVTAHMFPTFGIIFGSIPKDVMEEKPRNSTEIITKDILKIMILHMVLIGVAIVLIYYFTFNGVIGLSEFNLSGIGYGDPDEALPLLQIKARTMAFMVLFIMESVLMPVQIRRLKKPVKKSLQDIKYKEWHWYTTSFIILVVCIYSLSIQEWMGINLGWIMNFMYLDVWDWLIILITCFGSFFLFEFGRSRLFENKNKNKT